MEGVRWKPENQFFSLKSVIFWIFLLLYNAGYNNIRFHEKMCEKKKIKKDRKIYRRDFRNESYPKLHAGQARATNKYTKQPNKYINKLLSK